jgi:VCBS repeat-containing protein
VNQSFAINITGANDNPTLTAVAAASYTDTAINDTFSNITGTLAGSDRDTGTTITYGITNGAVANGTSTLSGAYGSLSINTSTGAYVYTPNSTAINALSTNVSDAFTFTVNDGTTTVNQSFAINITGVNDTPTLAVVIAGSYTDTTVNDIFSNITGTLMGADRDTNATLSYGITNGTVANGTSTLSGTYGILILNTSTGAYTYVPSSTAINALNTNASDTFTFTVYDGTNTANQSFVINITGVNDDPTLAAVVSGSYTDTVANDIFNNIVGTLTGANGSTGTLTYGIASGTVANGTSTISGTYGSLSVNTSTGSYVYTPNSTAINALSTNASDIFTFTVSDGISTVSQSFAINITGANDTPTLTAVAAASYTDTAINDTFSNITGALAGSDRDTGTTLSYGITNGTVTNGTSVLSGTYGILILNTSTGAYTYVPSSTAINALSTNASDTFTFTISDGISTVNQSFAINITGANDTPTLTAVAAASYTDTAINDTFSNITGTLTGNDRDTGTTLTYGIASGTLANGTSTLSGTYGSLSINTSTGAYAYTPNSTAINALSTNASDTFTFTVNDGISTVNQFFAINITGANDTPTLTAVEAGNYADTAINDTFSNITGTLTGNDRDTGTTLIYGIASGIVANGISTLSGTYGSLSINTSTGAYFYTPNSTAINALSTNVSDAFTFTVSDGISTVNQSFAINITGGNDTPTQLTVNNSQIPENVPINTVVGKLTSTDRDTNDIHTYSLTSGIGSTDNNLFEIVGDQLRIKASPDFETKASYTVRVKVTDRGGLSSEQTFAINITDINEPPTQLVINNSQVAENVPTNTVVGTFNTTSEKGDILTYSLANGEGSSDNQFFEIVDNTIRIKISPDFEIKSSYTVRVKATNQNGLSTEKTFPINITNLNETPSIPTLSNQQIVENSPINTVVGKLTATDPDLGDTLSYSLTTGEGSTNNNLFEIVGNELKLKISPDFEANPNYAVRIKVTDAAGLSSEKTFTINITDINEAPAQLVIDNQQIAENSPINTVVSKFTTTDPDIGDSFTYSLAPNDLFSITGNELRLIASPDFETKSSYQLQVKTTDKAGLSIDRPFTINITDIAEPTTLKNTNNQTFQISGDQGSKNITFQITSQHQTKFAETGLFKVDDNLGTINGIKPGAPGYLAAALDRFQIISSIIPIAHRPQGFDGNTNRSLNINYGDIVRFGVVNEGSIDQIHQIPVTLNQLTLSEPTTLQVTDSNSTLALNWQSPFNLNLTAKIDNSPTILGTTTQNNPQGELIDLRQTTKDVTATFSIYREATYNNNIYFYTIQNETGTIFDSTSNKTLKPNDSGYLQAALRNTIAEVNLSTPNQTTTTTTATLNKGLLLAPIIVVNGTKDALLDNNPLNDPTAYTPFILGNQDKVDHIRLLGDNTFGFEDLTGGGDMDYNDVIVKINLKSID